MDEIRGLGEECAQAIAERFAGQWIFFQATKPRFAPGCPTF